ACDRREEPRGTEAPQRRALDVALDERRQRQIAEVRERPYALGKHHREARFERLLGAVLDLDAQAREIALLRQLEALADAQPPALERERVHARPALDDVEDRDR